MTDNQEDTAPEEAEDMGGEAITVEVPQLLDKGVREEGSEEEGKRHAETYRVEDVFRVGLRGRQRVRADERPQTVVGEEFDAELSRGHQRTPERQGTVSQDVVLVRGQRWIQGVKVAAECVVMEETIIDPAGRYPRGLEQGYRVPAVQGFAFRPEEAVARGTTFAHRRQRHGAWPRTEPVFEFRLPTLVPLKQFLFGKSKSSGFDV